MSLGRRLDARRCEVARSSSCDDIVARRVIRLSCADNTFRLVQPWESAVELIRLLDIEAVDVCLMGNRSHIRPEDIRDDINGAAARITRGLAERDLAASDLFCIPWTDFERYAPNHPDAGERERSRALFADMLELAERIGAPGMTMLPGIDWPGESHEDSFGRSVEELASRAEQARARGVRFSIEPHFGSIAQEPREAKRLCLEAVGLELTLDYSHFVYQGYAQEEIEPLVVHARHFHARGAREKRMQAALKDSTIDFERMLDAAQAAGYDGDIGLEYLWIDWEHLNECDTVSETILLRDRLRAKLQGRPWSFPVSAI
jgi:sugar phosphate isomerase/epimerase